VLVRNAFGGTMSKPSTNIVVPGYDDYHFVVTRGNYVDVQEDDLYILTEYSTGLGVAFGHTAKEAVEDFLTRRTREQFEKKYKEAISRYGILNKED